MKAKLKPMMSRWRLSRSLTATALTTLCGACAQYLNMMQRGVCTLCGVRDRFSIC
jgi:hypothetical protein